MNVGRTQREEINNTQMMAGDHTKKFVLSHFQNAVMVTVSRTSFTLPHQSISETSRYRSDLDRDAHDGHSHSREASHSLNI